MAPISEYALLSDLQGAALVSRRGSVDWACLPAFDSSSLITRLLDPTAGHWLSSPAGRAPSSTRGYLEGTMVLRTEHTVGFGTSAVYDALALGPDDHGHRIGLGSPHILSRVVEGLAGEVAVRCDLRPRSEYGLTSPAWRAEPGGRRSRGGPMSLALSTDSPLVADAGSVAGTVVVASGQRACFSLQLASPWDEPVPLLSAGEIEHLLDLTIDEWRSWSDLHTGYQGPYAEQVRLAGRVLQALTCAPTGAVVAAPTTSLPEELGGARNWDYRYAWVRDASLTMQALWVAAFPREAGAFFDFFATAAGGVVDGSSPLQILDSVRGERHLAESTLPHLQGHRGSRPVRVGNAAWDQLQLDVYGELLLAACQLADQVGDFAPPSAELLITAADAAARRWREPDEGIWEVRAGRRHYLYSKLMCWVALDRACHLAPLLGAEDRVAGWSLEAAVVRQAILTNGWSDEAGAFTQAFGSRDLDAAALRLPTVGLLPPMILGSWRPSTRSPTG